MMDWATIFPHSLQGPTSYCHILPFFQNECPTVLVILVCHTKVAKTADLHELVDLIILNWNPENKNIYLILNGFSYTYVNFMNLNTNTLDIKKTITF